MISHYFDFTTDRSAKTKAIFPRYPAKPPVDALHGVEVGLILPASAASSSPARGTSLRLIVNVSHVVMG
jgi:hypothetical protein